MPTHHYIHRCIGNKTSLRFQVEFAEAVWITAGGSDQRSSTAIKPYERTSHSIVFSLRCVPYKQRLMSAITKVWNGEDASPPAAAR